MSSPFERKHVICKCAAEDKFIVGDDLFGSLSIGDGEGGGVDAYKLGIVGVRRGESGRRLRGAGGL